MDVPTRLVTLWLCTIGLAAGQSGVQFYVAFMGLDSVECAAGPHSDCKASVFITNPADTPTQVEVRYTGVPSASPQTVSLVGGASQEVTLSPAVILSGAGKHAACAVVSSGHPVLLQASLELNATVLSLAGYPVLPVTALTGDYVVATHCYSNNCSVVVTSAEDGNEVGVHVRTDGAGAAWYSGAQYSDGQGFTERLDKGESLQVTCHTCDLTGTLVSASGKVIVVGGGDFTRYGDGRFLMDTVADVMLPVQCLGQRYVLGSRHGALYEIVKVVVLKAGDSFTYDGVQQAAATRDRQVYVMPTRAMSSVVELTSPRPVLVLEVMASLDWSTTPDVSMTLALPAAQWSSFYRVYLPPDRDSLVLSLVTDIGSATFDTSVYPSSMYASSSNGLTTTSMDVSAAGGSHLTVTCRTGCAFSGFLMRNKHKRSSVVPLMPLQLELETTAEQATTTEIPTAIDVAATTTEMPTTTEAATTPQVATITTEVTATRAEAATATAEQAATATSTGELSTYSSPEITTQTTIKAYFEATSTVSSQPTTHSSNQATTHSSNHATTHSSNQATTHSSNQATTHSSNQATTLSSNQATTHSSNECTTHSSNQATTHSSNQATTHSSNQATTHSSNQATTHSSNQATEHSSNQAITQTSNQAIKPSSNQAITQTSNQAITQTNSRASSEATNQGSSLFSTEVSSEGDVSSNPTPISTPKPVGAVGRCCCLMIDTHSYNNSTRKSAEPEHELLLDRKSLSSYVRSKTCARNMKPSSVYLGSAVGAAIFGTAFAVVVMPDLISLLRHVVQRACRLHSQEARDALSSEASNEGKGQVPLV